MPIVMEQEAGHIENSLLLENQKLRLFIEIIKLVGQEHDTDRLFPLIITQLSKFMDAERSTLFLTSSDSGNLWTKYAEGLSDNTIVIELKVGIAGMCILTGQVVNVANAYENPRFNSEFDKITGFRTESIVAVPIRGLDGTVTGALQFLNKQTGLFTKTDEQMIQKMVSDFTREVAPVFDMSKERTAAFVENLRRLLQCERGTLYIRENDQIRSIVSEGIEDMEICLNINLGIAGRVAVTGAGMNISDAYADPYFDRRTDEKTGYHTRNILCVPVVNQANEVLGVIQVINKRTGAFTNADMKWLQVMSSMVAISLENAQLLAEQQRQFNSILKVMAASIDAKDSLTAGHSEEVEKYALGIAREMGFEERELDILSVAALLHDYGKIGVEDHILKKPGALTAEEFAQIRQHVTFTRNILNKMHLARKYRDVPMIAAGHHERLDGTGYDCNLKGSDIPFMSKIIAVADVFEALTADRHYRKAMNTEDALAILDKEASLNHLDKNIIAAFKAYLMKTS
jgi:HD-GYP domain-containing protein (c-di-GMP phosphodiesterase class II)